LVGRGVSPTLVPESFVAESLGDGLGDVSGMRILLPRAEGAREVLPEELSRRGAHVDVIPIYRAVTAVPDRRALDQLRQGIDVLTFTSPSTVRAFTEIVRAAELDPLRLPGDPECACIGPITEAAAVEAGYRPAIIAGVFTADGLIDALCAFYQEGNGDGDR
jgi:uroporphyrinogen-III synthase